MDDFRLLVLIAGGLLGCGLSYVIALARKSLKAKLPEGAMIVDNLFDCAAAVITKAAAASVWKLEQIVGKDLRELVKDGRADRDELYALANDAYREVIDTVSPEVMGDLRKYIGNAELYIKNVIEAELLKLKRG